MFKKIVLGVLTVLPILYLVVFFVAILSQSIVQIFPSDYLLISHLLMIAYCFMLLILYMVHVNRNARIESSEERFKWMRLLLIGTLASMIVYYYLYFIRDAMDHKQEKVT